MNSIFAPVKLSEVLIFRDQKADIQSRMIIENQPRAVVSLGLNIPGPTKTGEIYKKAFEAGMSQLEAAFRDLEIIVKRRQFLISAAGYSAVYATTGKSPDEIKKAAMIIENNHPLGRVFDIDVLNRDGKAIQRERLGDTARTCYVCDKPAKECARNQSHSTTELIDSIRLMIKRYFYEHTFK